VATSSPQNPSVGVGYAEGDTEGPTDGLADDGKADGWLLEGENEGRFVGANVGKLVVGVGEISRIAARPNCWPNSII
jgi:hypothetical protein